MLKFAIIFAVTVTALSAQDPAENSSSTVLPPNGVNGKLTPELHARIRQEIANKTYADFLHDMDTDGDHKISLNESVTYINQQWDAEITKEELYDLDHDGYITANEIDVYKTGS